MRPLRADSIFRPNILLGLVTPEFFLHVFEADSAYNVQYMSILHVYLLLHAESASNLFPIHTKKGMWKHTLNPLYIAFPGRIRDCHNGIIMCSKQGSMAFDKARYSRFIDGFPPQQPGICARL